MRAPTARLQRCLRDEHGFAMITALLSIIVASLLGLIVVNLSLHSTQSSGYDRARTQAVHAAEAGLDQALALFASSPSLPCTLTGTLTASPPATWTVDITYYSSYPLIGAPMTCVAGYLSGATAPGGAALYATGSVGGFAPGTIERHMEMQVSLDPEYSSFNKAMFSNSTPSISGNITVYGEDGNDADFLTNGDWTCANPITIYGSVIVQGTASLSNSCRAAVDLWVNGNISMAGQARVDHDVKSSTGSLTMANSASVGNNVTVGTTCTGCTTGSSGRIGGTVTTGNVQPQPPVTPFPTVEFDAAAWIADGWSIEYFTNCTTAMAWITNSTHDDLKNVIRITGGCTLSFAQNTTINREADLAIFTDGEITTNNNTTFRSTDGSWHDLFLIVQSSASCAGTDGRITMSNQTSFEQLYFFVYSPCASTFANNNSTARGQIYGQVVGVSNNLTFTFHAMLVPGAGDISGYRAGTAFVREVD
jgi:type II secretory pathway pseudopilin PulG